MRPSCLAQGSRNQLSAAALDYGDDDRVVRPMHAHAHPALHSSPRPTPPSQTLVFARGPAQAILKCAVVAAATATAAESLVRRSGAGAEGVAVAHVARRTRLQTWLTEAGGLGVGAGVGWSAQIWNSKRGRGFGAGRSIEI